MKRYSFFLGLALALIFAVSSSGPLMAGEKCCTVSEKCCPAEGAKAALTAVAISPEPIKEQAPTASSAKKSTCDKQATGAATSSDCTKVFTGSLCLPDQCTPGKPGQCDPTDCKPVCCAANVKEHCSK